MQEPTKLPHIFCHDGTGSDRSEIPETKITTGSASWSAGFPPETQKPLDAGGIAPRRQDFNQMFYLLTEALKYAQNGGLWSYDPALEYKPLDMVTADGALWLCKQANGPDSVQTPASDVTEQYWSRLFSDGGRESLLEKAYPVGSVYISTSAANPASLFGFGTWRQLQGRFLVGSSAAHPLGATGGSATNVLSIGNIPGHSHSVTISSGGAHAHTASSASAGGHTHTASTASAGAHTHSGSASSAGAHQHTGTTSYAGNHHHGAWGEHSGAYDAYWPFGVYDYNNTHTGSQRTDADNQIFNTSTDGQHTHSLTTDSGGAHTHSITANSAGAHSHSLTTASAGAHSHAVTVDNAGSHSHAVTVGSTGNGEAVNNLPPYISVNMWERTA